MRKVTPTAETLDQIRECLSYDPLTGTITWAQRPGVRSRVAVGTKAGTAHPKGYWVISISYQRFLAQSVAWFLHYGEWPDHQIDHRDNDRLNNRIVNLRRCTQTQNNGNSHHPVGSTGFRGVRQNTGGALYGAQITIKNKQKFLGSYPTPEEAAEAYDQAAINHFGEFATLNFSRKEAA